MDGKHLLLISEKENHNLANSTNKYVCYHSPFCFVSSGESKIIFSIHLYSVLFIFSIKIDFLACIYWFLVEVKDGSVRELLESIRSFCHVCPRDYTQAIRLNIDNFFLLTHHANPQRYVLQKLRYVTTRKEGKWF